MDPPDFGKHAAIGQAEAKSQKPEASLDDVAKPTIDRRRAEQKEKIRGIRNKNNTNLFFLKVFCRPVLAHLAHQGEVPRLYVVPIQTKWEDGSESQYASCRRNVVQVRLGILDVPEEKKDGVRV